jgi:hypothetical protein
MKIDGRCHCGYITYEAEIDPEKVMVCHCADCQTLSGSAFRTVVFTREDTFKLLSGELKTGESGTKRPQSFRMRNANLFEHDGRGPEGTRDPRWHRSSTRPACPEVAALVSLVATMAE